MENHNIFSIESQIIVQFTNSNTCDIAHQSLLPDLNAKSSIRSQIKVEKEAKSLIFRIKSLDITAFRASINEIINFFRIYENILEINSS